MSSESLTESRDQPGSQAAAVVAVLAALVAGVGTIGASSVMSSALPRVLVALVLIAVGWSVTRPANDPGHPLSVALGVRVLRGIGTSLVVLGGYLFGLGMLTAVVSDSPDSLGASLTVLVLLVYGSPVLALLVVAVATRMRAWVAGAGALLPMLVVLLLITAEVPADAVSVTMLVVAVALAVFVVRAPAGIPVADGAAATAAMSASFAFGAGTSPFGSLGTTQFGGAAGPTGEGLTGGVQLGVAVGALLVGAVLLVVAVLRRDLASGVLVGAMFATPPILMQDMGYGGWLSGTGLVVLVAPALVAVLAVVALRFHGFRRAVVGLRPADPPPDPVGAPGRAGDAVSAAAFAVVLAAAVVVFVVMAMPVLGWNSRVQGVVALLVLVAATALGAWLPPGRAGAAAAVVALLGFALGSPWIRLFTGGELVSSAGLRTVAGIADPVVAALVVWLLVRRHPRPSVFAASAYLLAGSVAAFVGSLLFNPVFGAGQAHAYDSEWAPVLVVALPLLLLAVPSAVFAFGRRIAIAQAVGAVALAAGGFVPMKVLVGEYTNGLAGYATQASLDPLTPTDWLGAALSLRTVTTPVLVMMLILVLVGFVLAASLARRPCAPLAAAMALLLLSVVQAAMLTALIQWSADEAQVVGWSLGGAALVAALVASAAAQTAAARHRHLPTATG